MYPFDFQPKRKSINPYEAFVAMPFEPVYDPIYCDLIEPATKKANEILKRKPEEALKPYRTKDDIRTVSGWINVLERLCCAQVVIGVLAGDNPNVFYELGIAHATQPRTRQVLIAPKEYDPKFDLKDLIYFQYENESQKSIEPLAVKIADAVTWHKLEEERTTAQARAQLGPYEFEVVRRYGAVANFALLDTDEFKTKYEEREGVGSYERHLLGIANLCHIGLLGLHTAPPNPKAPGVFSIEFSYHWTGLGNQVLAAMKIIQVDEVRRRLPDLPPHFE